MNLITKERLDAMLEEEEKSGRSFIEWGGCKEVDGFLYGFWTDKRTGQTFAAREIRTVSIGFNSNDPGKEEKFVDIVEREGVCKASWGVTGRTMHQILAKKLEEKYPQYRFDIGYNYECVAYK